jgi:membrane protein required for colicin V production
MSLSVTTVDAVVVLVLLVSTGYAIWRGFLWETLTIFAWVAAAFGCLYFAPSLRPLAHSLVSADWLASLIAYAVVFLAVLIPLSFMTHRFSQTVKGSPIGPFDRALGAAFGLIRGLVIVGLAYIAFTWVVPVAKQPQWLARAQLLPMIQDTDEVILSLVPERDKPAFALGSRPRDDLPQQSERKDALGDMIRREEAGNSKSAAPAEGGTAQHRNTTRKTAAGAKKPYGAGDRQALDKLIETTGNSK